MGRCRRRALAGVEGVGGALALLGGHVGADPCELTRHPAHRAAGARLKHFGARLDVSNGVSHLRSLAAAGSVVPTCRSRAGQRDVEPTDAAETAVGYLGDAHGGRDRSDTNDRRVVPWIGPRRAPRAWEWSRRLVGATASGLSPMMAGPLTAHLATDEGCACRSRLGPQ